MRIEQLALAKGRVGVRGEQRDRSRREVDDARTAIGEDQRNRERRVDAAVAEAEEQGGDVGHGAGLR